MRQAIGGLPSSLVGWLVRPSNSEGPHPCPGKLGSFQPLASWPNNGPACEQSPISTWAYSPSLDNGFVSTSDIQRWPRRCLLAHHPCIRASNRLDKGISSSLDSATTDGGRKKDRVSKHTSPMRRPIRGAVLQVIPCVLSREFGAVTIFLLREHAPPHP
jgi:hypothetical protein